MKFKIEKIRNAELQIDKLVGQEKKMRREFLADGTIDADEQKKINGVETKIDKLKGVVSKARAEIEAARRAWEARSNDFARLTSDVQELGTWGHADHTAVKKAFDKIAPEISDEQWSEATIHLDATLKICAPAMEDYHKQVEAKSEYDPLRKDTDTRMSRAAAADPFTTEIETRHTEIDGQLNIIDDSLGTKDYVTALETLKDMQSSLAALEELIKVARQQKADYDTSVAELAPRLKEAKGCVVEVLADKQTELADGADQIKETIGTFDYLKASGEVADLREKAKLYMEEYATVVDAKTLYDGRLPRVEAALAAINKCQFPDLSTQQKAILDADKVMRDAAGGDDYEKAIETMNALDPLLETFKQDEENARLGAEFDAEVTALEPKMASVRVCQFTPLEVFQGKITAAHEAAAKAASDKKFSDGLMQLGDVGVMLGDFDVKHTAQETAKADYDGAKDQIKDRYEAASSCPYPQLSTQAADMIALHDSMTEASTSHDFVSALVDQQGLHRELGIFETTLFDLQAKDTEYQTRQPALVQRFDSLMISDFEQLEDERASLKTGRADMESAAGNRDYPLAVDHLEAVERMLNDLDAQAGNLVAQKEQYETVLKQITAGLELVDACDHVELTIKKTPIMETRADMLALAIEEDFGLALARASSLILPLLKFAMLEAQVKDYLRRLGVIEPRLEKLKGLSPSYKSLVDRQTTIESKFAEMTAFAAKAELTDALGLMDQLEKLVTEFLDLHEQLKLKEEVYKYLLSNLQPDMTTIEANKITKEEVKKAAEAATKSWTKFKKFGEEHEFVKAVDHAEELKAKITAFLAAVDQHGDAKDAYELLKGIAAPKYKTAKEQAGEYEDLDRTFGDLELKDKFKEMNEAGEGESPDYDDAKAKAQALLDGLKKFDAGYVEITNREAAVNSAADSAFERFGKIKPKDVTEKARDDYDDAMGAKDDLEGALSNKKLERAENKVKELNTALDKVEGLLKTKEQHKIDYDARFVPLKARVAKAEASPFANGLKTEFKAVKSALEIMKKRAEAEDYEGGVKAAPAVETQLEAHNIAEDTLEQTNAVLLERIGEIDKDMPKLKENVSIDLVKKIAALQVDYNRMKDEYSKKELKKAEVTSLSVRDTLRAILDEIEKIEDEQAKSEEDKSLTDRVVDLADDAFDAAVDLAKDEALDYLDGKIKGAKNLASGVDDLMDGEIIDGAIDIVKGLDDLSPIPVSKTVRKGAKIAEKVYDSSGEIVDAAEDAYDYIKSKL